MPDKPKKPIDVLVDALVTEVRDQFYLVLDPEGVLSSFVDDRVRELVDRGDLIPRARLQLGTALELAPTGLTAACRSLLASLEDEDFPAADAVAVVRRVLEGTDDDEEAEDAEDPEDPDDEPSPVTDTEPQGRERRTCERCDDDVDTEQAIASWTRWRHVLCKTHHEEGWTDDVAG